MRRFSEDKFKIVDFDQSSDEWLEWRNDGIGSSDVALLMSPERVFDRTVVNLWQQRLGLERAVELDNEHIKRGKELEPIIRDLVNAKLNTKFHPVCMERKDFPYLRASLDGYDKNLGAILEIKAPSEKYFKEYLDSWRIPENYYLQMQYQMLVANVEYAYFAFYNKDILLNEDVEHPEPYIIPVKSKINLQLEIEKRCTLFWRAVEEYRSVGWIGDSLKIIEEKPTLFILIDNLDKYKKYYDKCIIPIHKYNSQDNYSNTVAIDIQDKIHLIPSLIKKYEVTHRIKLISTIPNIITPYIVDVKSAKDLNRTFLNLAVSNH